jgi:hypothetical protein
MAADKTHDVSIQVGSYTDRDGKTKSRSRTVGKLMRGEDGRMFIILHAEVLNTSLFALANPKRQDSVILNCWEERKETTQSAPTGEVDENGIPF